MLIKDLLYFIDIALSAIVRVLIVLNGAGLGNRSMVWVNTGAL